MTRSAFDRLTHLRKRAHSLRIGLLSRLSEYSSDFPSGTPKAIIQLIKQILTAAVDPIDSAIDERFLEQACRKVQAMGTLLGFFDNAHTAQTPRGLTELVSQLMKELQPDADLIVWPQADFNYSIGNLLPALKASTQYFLSAKAFNDIFGSFTGPLNLVSFPRIERDNVLLHAILGHELGHPIADKYLNSEKGTPKYADGLRSAVEKLTGDVASGSATGNGALDTLGPDLTRLLEMRTRGLEEIISDTVSVLLFGFSAIFAEYDVLTVNRMDALPDDEFKYPPNRFRLRVQSKVAERIGHTAAIRSLREKEPNQAVVDSAKCFLDHLDVEIANHADIATLQSDRVVGIAYVWIEDTLEDAISFAIKEVGSTAFDVGKVEGEVPELIERIELGLPPNEIGIPPHAKPVDWRSAILAAWLYRLHGKKLTGADKGKVMTADQYEQLNKLTMKAVEYITLQKRYATYISTGAGVAS